MEDLSTLKFVLAIFILITSAYLFGIGVEFAIDGKVIPAITSVAPLLMLLAWGATR